jgi:hypothetical protein
MLKAVLPRNASRLALLGLLAWTLFACALELHRSEWLLRHDPFPEEQPSRWRITSRPVRRLAGFLSAVKPVLPAGSRVAVTNEPGTPEERFFRSLWIAYYLPGVETRPASAAAAGLPVDFQLTYGTRADDPRLIPVLTAPEGTLYRVRGAPGAYQPR